MLVDLVDMDTAEVWATVVVISAATVVDALVVWRSKARLADLVAHAVAGVVNVFKWSASFFHLLHHHHRFQCRLTCL